MVGRTSDVVASVQVSSTQQKPARSQSAKEPSANDSFGSLVDSNTQAISSNAAAQAQESGPRRSDSSSSSQDKGPRDSSSADQSSQSKASDDTDASAASDKPNDTSADPAKDAGKDKVKDKSETSDAKSADTSDETKGDKAEATDGLAAAVDAAATAPTDAAPAVPDPNAIVVAAPSVPADPNATANQAANSSPLAIAAAGLAASASTAAQIAGKTDTATPGDKSAKTAGAKVDAETSATLADAATGATGEAATDAKPNGGLIPVNPGTPKTSFQAVAAAQGQSDVSNIGQDTGKANDATTPAPGTAAANPAAHPQGAKPQADGTVTEAKAADRSADASQGAPATQAHAGTQNPTAPTDASAQAASAVQAPLTQTTSTASASTATLTATAATTTAVPVSGVPVEIAAAIRSGRSRFDISLDPAELGRIDVRIHVDRAGNVTSHLTVEKPETLQMLRQDAPQLQRALDDAGLKTGSNGLSFSLRDQNSSGQNSGQNNDNGGNARRLIISEDDSVAAAPVGRSYGRMLGSSSGVDIRV